MDLTKEIQAFCDAEKSRYNLDRPWLTDGRIAATDGRALVVCLREVFHGTLGDEGAKVPDITNLLAAHRKAEGWEPVPMPPPCPTCNCTGEIWERGVMCGALGEPIAGPLLSGRCDDPACAIEVFGRRLARKYTNLFTAFPGCRWAVAPDGDAVGFVGFEFEAGVGLLNCLAPE